MTLDRAAVSAPVPQIVEEVAGTACGMSVMMQGMATIGTVRFWRAEDGWGVIDSASTPGGCWVHFCNVAAPGYGRLEPGQLVELEWEPVQQDGYSYRAVRAWPKGQQPHSPAAETAPTDAYHSTLTLTFDEPPPP